MNIKENIRSILTELPKNVSLIAVSKTKPSELIQEAYSAGQSVFGENYVQELVDKQSELPEDIQWHFIGHLQSNKVKYIAPFISCIQSVDSLKLLKEINKQASKNDRILDCMLEFSIAKDGTKFGFSLEEVLNMFKENPPESFANIRFIGVMGMGSFSDDKELTRNEYRTLAEIFNDLKQKVFPDKKDFIEISMGMTNDYHIAIEEGSTMIRIGTQIFGARDCKV